MAPHRPRPADHARDPLAETRSVDDQAVWIGGTQVAYSLPGDYGSDLWTVPPTAPAPRRFLTAALNPVF